MIMCKKLLGLIVGVVSMTMMLVSSVEEEIVNEGEFKTLCDFVSLTQRISSSLELIEKSGVSVSFLQKKVTDVLFGTGIGDVSKMKWQPHRDMDCGQDNRVKPASAGRALVQDTICLCDGRDQKPPKKNLCYKESGEHRRYTYWWDSQGHGNTWSHLRNGCKTERGGSAPKEAVFKELKRQLQAGSKTYPGATESAYYTYGGRTNFGLHTCRGTPTETDGICLLYRRVSDGDNASGIEWVGELEDLVKQVEEISRSANADTDTNINSNTSPNTKPSTSDSLPVRESHRSTQNGAPNTQATISTETGLTTTRPPEEQKSSAKIISRSLWILSFLLFYRLPHH
uniref:Variant surface glycoprotein 1125.5268 n=1 Tax=Trypanosoma brucei TaxID=5691 RepID=A0A1J0RCG1_9TRYP|nr:variant surface glycoprotein 1125.5268 [Trypanosoma brucei]